MIEILIILVKTIRSLIRLRVPLPQPIPNKHQPNELDRNIMQMRKKYLKQIVKKCEKIPNMEFKYVVEELQNLSNSLSHLIIEVKC